jgi:hypothetical protein
LISTTYYFFSFGFSFSVNIVFLIILLAFQSVVPSQHDSINSPFDHDVSLAEESSFKDETYELASHIDDFSFKNEDIVNVDQTSTTINVDKEEEKVVKNEDVTTTMASGQFSSENTAFILKPVESEHSSLEFNDDKRPTKEESEVTDTTTTPSSVLISTLSSNTSKVNSGINVHSILSTSLCDIVGMLFCNHTTLICRGNGEIDCEYTNELLAEDDPKKNECKMSESLTCFPLPLITFCSGKAQCRQKANALLDKLGVRELSMPTIVIIVIVVVVVVAVLAGKGLM